MIFMVLSGCIYFLGYYGISGYINCTYYITTLPGLDSFLNLSTSAVDCKPQRQSLRLRVKLIICELLRSDGPVNQARCYETKSKEKNLSFIAVQPFIAFLLLEQHNRSQLQWIKKVKKSKANYIFLGKKMNSHINAV